MTKKKRPNLSQDNTQQQGGQNLICAPAQWEKTAQVPHGQPSSEAAKHTTRVVHWLVCSTIFCRDLESAGDASFRRLSYRKLEVQPLLVVPGLVFRPQPKCSLGRRWRTHGASSTVGFASLGAQRSSHVPPRGSPPGPQMSATECWHG